MAQRLPCEKDPEMRQTLATVLVFCAALAQAQLLESLLYGPENVEEASRKTPQEGDLSFPSGETLQPGNRTAPSAGV